ncbi:hypothetical protein CDIK_3407 [Cucumispora dikerogammari]|nr:hypothetical protein CDIK_3407 [Cucumispora dikerogammari]
MLVLIYFLSIKPYYEKKPGEDWSDVKITNCVDENGKCVESPFIENSCNYMLSFCQIKKSCFLSVDFLFKHASTLSEFDFFHVQLVKCTENIGFNGFHIIDEVKFKCNGNKYEINYNSSGNTRNNMKLIRAIVSIVAKMPSIKYHKLAGDSNESYYYTGDKSKSKSITQFRKEFGIIGDKIKTTKFKFRIGLLLWSHGVKIKIKIHMETKSFSISEKDDGTLVLNKEVEPQRCVSQTTKNI